MQALMTIDEIGQRRVGAHRGGIAQKWTLDTPRRRLILARYDGRSETITELADCLQVPRYVVKKWGRQLGLARQKEARWTDEELDYLEHAHGRVGTAQIARHLGRTQTAVKLKMKRLGLRKSGEGYTMRGLCAGLGCDHHKALKWIENGWLRGARRHSERLDVQGGDMWYFSDAAIRDLVRNHPTEVDQRRVEWIWLVDVLTAPTARERRG